MPHFVHGHVTCLYVPFYLVGDSCAQIVAIFLVYVSILACRSALYIFEKHKGEESTQFMVLGGVLHQGKKKGRKIWRNAFVQGELAFMLLGSSCLHEF
jgi:hypothetical protein